MKKKKIQIARQQAILKRLLEHPRMAFKKIAAITEADRKGEKSDGKISTNLLHSI